MNDIRRTILWVIFGFSLVMLWDQWQVYNGRQATFFPGATPAAVKPQAPAGTASAPNSLPSSVPSGSVVISGNLPKKTKAGQDYSTYAAIIVKTVDAQTRSKTSLNDLLRD